LLTNCAKTIYLHFAISWMIVYSFKNRFGKGLHAALYETLAGKGFQSL